MTVTSGGNAATHATADRQEQNSGGRRSLLVVGIDGSTASIVALRWAAEHACRTGARVVAIAASEPTPLVTAPDMLSGVMIPDTVDDEQLAAEADRWLTDAIATLPPEVRPAVEQRVAHGDATTVLLQAAGDADLLVLGNHGRGPLAGALLGSVAQQCVQHATCPLVLVPAPEETPDDDR